jgi:hypothetical protein
MSTDRFNPSDKSAFPFPVPVCEPLDLQHKFVSGLAREESTLEASLTSGLYKVTMRT